MSELTYNQAKAAVEEFEREWIGQSASDLWQACVEKATRNTSNVYMQAYRAGWNDALREALREAPDVFTYAELKQAIHNKIIS